MSTEESWRNIADALAKIAGFVVEQVRQPDLADAGRDQDLWDQFSAGLNAPENQPD